MAGANNAFLKSLGFHKRDIKKIRATYGAISSAKDARIAADRAGVRVPQKLSDRLADVGPSSKLTRETGVSLKTKTADLVARSIEKGPTANVQMGAKLGKRESGLAKKLTDRQVQIMAVAQRELTSFQSTGKWNHNALKPHEWEEAQKILESV